MENLDLSNVVGAVSAPFIQATGQHLNSAISTLGDREWRDIIPSAWSGNSHVVILRGCYLDTTVKRGVVFHNGNVYDFENPNNLADGYFTIQVSYLGTDPVKYSDGNFYSQHRVTKMILQASSVGSTGILYSSANTRIDSIFEDDLGYATNKIPMTQIGVVGNQFQLGATNVSDKAAIISIKNTGTRKGIYLVYDVEITLRLARSTDANTTDTSNTSIRFNLANIFNQTDILLEMSASGSVGVVQSSAGIIAHHIPVFSWDTPGRLLEVRLDAINNSGTSILYNTATSYITFKSKMKLQLLVP